MTRNIGQPNRFAPVALMIIALFLVSAAPALAVSIELQQGETDNGYVVEKLDGVARMLTPQGVAQGKVLANGKYLVTFVAVQEGIEIEHRASLSFKDGKVERGVAFAGTSVSRVYVQIGGLE